MAYVYEDATVSEGALTLAGKMVFLMVLAYWSWQLFTLNPPWIFIDNANLMVHEAGHLLFAFMGDFMGRLGGTFLQLMVPLMVMVGFGIKRDWYSVGFGTWWLGNNLINVATYMKDASRQHLPLVGNGTHDWYNLFITLGVLDHDQAIGGFFFGLGVVVVAFGLVGMVIATVMSRFAEE